MSSYTKYPFASRHNWLVFKLLMSKLEPAIKRHLKGRLLDIGCSNKPFEFLTNNLVDEHVGLDHQDSLHPNDRVDVFGTAYEIPFPDNEFESVLCTYVLEHLEEPKLALKEAYRVLKPGGIAIYTVPFFWHIHEEPRDFYRYTRYGLEYLAAEVNFKMLEIHALSGFWGNVGQMFSYHINNQKILNNRFTIPLKRVILFAIQHFAYFLNKFSKSDSFTNEYMIVLQKP